MKKILIICLLMLCYANTFAQDSFLSKLNTSLSFKLMAPFVKQQDVSAGSYHFLVTEDYQINNWLIAGAGLSLGLSEARIKNSDGYYEHASSVFGMSLPLYVGWGHVAKEGGALCIGPDLHIAFGGGVSVSLDILYRGTIWKHLYAEAGVSINQAVGYILGLGYSF